MIRNRFTQWLAARFPAESLANRRDPDFVIGGRDNPYLLRWWIIPRNPVFNVYLHQMLRDDDDRAHHDHPWVSISLMLRGELIEVYRDDQGEERVRSILAGSLVYRGSRFAHRLIVPRPGAFTLFVTGPRIRTWGFYCPQGWRDWKSFTSPADKGAVGRGCE